MIKATFACWDCNEEVRVEDHCSNLVVLTPEELLEANPNFDVSSVGVVEGVFCPPCLATRKKEGQNGV